MENRSKKVSIYFSLLLLTCISCSDFLDMKSDRSLAIPTKLNDLQLLLDNNFTMNLAYPSTGEEGTDNYFISEANYNSIANANARDHYVWDDVGNLNSSWNTPYKVVFFCNTVLEELDALGFTDADPNYGNIKGSAMFFRAFAFFELASLFALPYSAGNSDKLGIPIRLSTDHEFADTRASLGQTYHQIIDDLTEAMKLLPVMAEYNTRPNKQAASAMLARVYLSMSDYPSALTFAEKAISYGGGLMDYNDTNVDAAVPFQPFNDEVVFMAGTSAASALMNVARCRVDTLLFEDYEENDLRKAAFFRPHNDGYHVFKGSYDGRVQGQLFRGLTIGEMFLIKAECEVRAGLVQDGMKTMTDLLKKRYRDGDISIDPSSTQGEALEIVLRERRKELVFRGLRWMDLKRLNLEEGQDKTIRRQFGNTAHVLEPNEHRYVFLIPTSVIDLSSIVQNPR